MKAATASRSRQSLRRERALRHKLRLRMRSMQRNGREIVGLLGIEHHRHDGRVVVVLRMGFGEGGLEVSRVLVLSAAPLWIDYGQRPSVFPRTASQQSDRPGSPLIKAIGVVEAGSETCRANGGR